MIIGDTFLWLHLPKTGGTSMNLLFRRKKLAGVVVDADSTAQKHDSIALRERRSDWRANNRQRFITCRRLDDWLISDWQFKKNRMHLPDLPFEPVRSGLFFSLRLGGLWVAADWWINYFSLDERVISLRLDTLQSDLNRWMLPLLPAGTAPFETPPHANSGSTQAHQQPRLNPADLQRIAVVNPRWTAWQSKVYNDIPQP